jgi:hypothetical protein
MKYPEAADFGLPDARLPGFHGTGPDLDRRDAPRKKA